MPRRVTKRRIAALSAAVALLSLFVVATGSSGASPSATARSAAAAGPINILFVSSNEGPTGPYSLGQQKIIQALVSQWNAAGGILGRHVNLILKDDGGTATNGVSILRDQLGSTQLSYVLNLSDEFAEAPILKQDKILNGAEGGIASLDNASVYPYTFGDVTVTGAYALADDYWLMQHKYHKIAFIYASDFVTTPFVDTFTQTLKQFPALKMVGSESVQPTQVDTSPQLTALRAKKPDVLIVEGLPPSYGGIMKNLSYLGWHVPVLLSPGGIADTAAPTEVVSQQYLKGTVCLSYRDSLLQNGSAPPGALGLLAKLHKILGPKLPFSFRSYMFEYDEVLLAKVAWEGAHSTDSVKAAAYLASLSAHYPSPNPFYQHLDLTAQNHYPHDYSGFVFVNCGVPTNADGFFKFAENVPWPASMHVAAYPAGGA